MAFRRFVLILTVVVLFGQPLAAQSFNLRDLLTNFFRQGITLAEPPAGSPFPSHAHHFVGDASLVPLEQLNKELATQLSTFPLASSAGGFAYRLDPALGVFTRVTDSFGPIYTERADTNGKGKFAMGLNFSYFSFNRIDDISLRTSGVQIVLTHQDLPPRAAACVPSSRGTSSTTKTFLKIQTDITAFTLSYGVTDRLDVGAAIPVVKREDRGADGGDDQQARDRRQSATVGIHKFPNGEDSETFQESGSASGLGDVVLRAKYRAISGDTAANGVRAGREAADRRRSSICSARESPRSRAS